jgi:superfamily II DNA or RNA helicase
MFTQQIKPNYSEIRSTLYNNLRCYQKSAIDAILNLFSKGTVKAILRQNFTGTGKSVEQNFVAVDWLNQSENNSYLFLIHREELLDNAAQYFEQNQVPYTFIRKGFKCLYSKRAFLAGVDYFKNAKRLAEFKEYLENYNKKLLIVIDETHHSASKSWTKIIEYFPEALKVGFSATPERLDGKGFDNLFEHLILGNKYKWYVENKFLAPFKIHLPKQIEMQLTRGDSVNEQEEQMTDEILGDAVKIWHEFTPGLKTFTFCPTIAVSKKVAEMYNAFGKIEYNRDEIARHLDGSSDKKYRRESIQRFNLPSDHSESLLILTNVELFIEGVSINDCSVTQHLRFTESEIFFDQMNGRSNRYLPGKVQHIIDHVGNIKKHGLPDRERTYDLKGRKKREKENKFKLICLNCNYEIAKDYRELNNLGEWVECPQCSIEQLIPLVKSSVKFKLNCRKCAKVIAEDFRILQKQGLQEVECKHCQCINDVPEVKIKQFEFDDCEFTTLTSENYALINMQALFGKLSKISSDRKFLDKIVELPHSDLDMLIAACKYRELPESWAISAWSRKLQKLVMGGV